MNDYNIVLSRKKRDWLVFPDDYEIPKIDDILNGDWSFEFDRSDGTKVFTANINNYYYVMLLPHPSFGEIDFKNTTERVFFKIPVTKNQFQYLKLKG